MIRTYSELLRFSTVRSRYDYLKLPGSVGQETLGWMRYASQALYKSKEWRLVRDEVILRDDGCDLGLSGMEIHGKILVHHMNPITQDDIRSKNHDVFDPEFLICVSEQTHNAIHFGDFSLIPQTPVVRFPGDTKLW